MLIRVEGMPVSKVAFVDESNSYISFYPDMLISCLINLEYWDYLPVL
ncbi:Unannotated [Lentimonas sp. CC4]|nr:Unannotated [Lentimonas sp. CC4]CAA6685981.1 Unannotated [Lentimonas sp. CC6]CAA7075930.1 Unannotated [Lentimonas sp. CC4]CAA7168643.1 Unannotated [Lentimonas sp. CC21]CAA7181034.1 Unannotated [Lentimonas sp. CC8]